MEELKLVAPSLDDKESALSMLEEIKKIDENAKIVMCSAMGQQMMVVDAIKSGAKDFIVKPFEKDRVLEALRKTTQN